MNKFLLKAVFIISTFILLSSATALAQTVKGVVRDSETGEPLAGVVVMFERVADDPTANMTGTQTEADGSYILQIPEGIEGVLGLYFTSTWCFSRRHSRQRSSWRARTPSPSVP